MNQVSPAHTLKIISKADAKAQGLTRFYTGKPCKRGHLSERSLHGNCIQCERERSKGAYKGKGPAKQAEIPQVRPSVIRRGIQAVSRWLAAC